MAKYYNLMKMSLSDAELLLGDLLSPFDQSCWVAEEGLGQLDDYLEVAKNLDCHGFSSNKAKVGSSKWPDVDGLNSATDSSQEEDAFSGMDWMVEKMDLKEFDFSALLSIDDLESTVSPDELMATLEDACDPFDLSIQEISNKETSVKPEPIIHSPKSPLEADQVAPLIPLSFPLPPKSQGSPVDHSVSLELGSEVDVLEGEAHILLVVIPKHMREEETHSDNDSGIGMSPESYLGTPQRSPTNSFSSLSDSQTVTVLHDVSVRPKPYDHLPEKVVSVKVKGEKRIDKKLKKMEQNKTAATRYRQKKRVAQEALSGECRALEQKNEALREKADSLSKEIEYLKDLIEEVRKAKSKRSRIE